MAQPPTDLVGWYDLGPADDGGGDSVTIELRLRLLNASDAAIEVAGISLVDSVRTAIDLATIPGFTLEPRVPLDRVQLLTIPRAEYDLWRRGAVPKLKPLSADGRRTGGRIELTRCLAPMRSLEGEPSGSSGQRPQTSHLGEEH